MSSVAPISFHASFQLHDSQSSICFYFRIKVLRLNQSTIAELHSYIKPPDEVSTVMRATFLLLGHSEKEIQVRKMRW